MEHVFCALCGSDDTRIVSRRGIFQKNGPVIPFINVVCLHDGLVYRTPRETAEELDSLYKKIYIEKRHSFATTEAAAAFVQGIDQKNKGQQIAEFLKEFFRPDSAALDVGAGLGLVGGYLKKNCDLSVLGIEPSAVSAEVARTVFGVDVFSGTLDEFMRNRAADQTFDCILLHHVFEHFGDPKGKLREIESLLKPDGILYIEVPNVLDFKKPISQFFDLLHLFNYAPQTLFAMLAAGGFKVIRWNANKKYRIQIVAVRSGDPRPAIPMPGISGAMLARRIRAYCRTRALLETVRRILDPLHRTFAWLRSPQK